MTTIDGILSDSLKTGLKVLLGLAVLSGLLAGIFGWQLPAYIPMFFSRPFGEKQLVPFWVFFLYPLLSLLFYLLGLGVYKKFTNSLVTLAMFLWLTVVAIFMLVLSQIYVLFLIY